MSFPLCFYAMLAPGQLSQRFHTVTKHSYILSALLSDILPMNTILESTQQRLTLPTPCPSPCTRCCLQQPAPFSAHAGCKTLSFSDQHSIRQLPEAACSTNPCKRLRNALIQAQTACCATLYGCWAGSSSSSTPEPPIKPQDPYAEWQALSVSHQQQCSACQQWTPQQLWPHAAMGHAYCHGGSPLIIPDLPMALFRAHDALCLARQQQQHSSLGATQGWQPSSSRTAVRLLQQQ